MGSPAGGSWAAARLGSSGVLLYVWSGALGRCSVSVPGAGVCPASLLGASMRPSLSCVSFADVLLRLSLVPGLLSLCVVGVLSCRCGLLAGGSAFLCAALRWRALSGQLPTTAYVCPWLPASVPCVVCVPCYGVPAKIFVTHWQQPWML